MRTKAPYRLVILKQRFPASTGKTIVRKSLISTVLTIIDSDVLEDGSYNLFLCDYIAIIIGLVIGKYPMTL